MSDVPARPLTARSIIASTLLGTHPPRMPSALLVASCELFGIRENAARVALSRMVAAGELTVDHGRYELTGRLLVRQLRQDRSRRGNDPDASWDGTWRLAVVTGESRSASERADFRRSLGQLRFGEWREGLWARPDNLDPTDNPTDNPVGTGGCTMVPGSRPPDPRALAARLFPVTTWALRARSLVDHIDRMQRRLKPGDSHALAESFVVNATVLRHLQADPLLPGELLPSRWPGDRLRNRYEHFNAGFLAIWRDHLRS